MDRRRKGEPPRYRLHKKSGKAVVSLPLGNGLYKDLLLGSHDTQGSRQEYARVIAGDAYIPLHHRRFLCSLERGVRDLVLVLTGRHSLITYTSCEGHRYEGLPLAPTERHGGLLPRSWVEAKRIRDFLVEMDAAVGFR